MIFIELLLNCVVSDLPLLLSLLIHCCYSMQIEYPEIEDLAKPRHRFMSSYEQVN